jgi:hypothetical protein
MTLTIHHTPNVISRGIVIILENRESEFPDSSCCNFLSNEKSLIQDQHIDNTV